MFSSLQNQIALTAYLEGQQLMRIDLYVAELINGHCHETCARMTRGV